MAAVEKRKNPFVAILTNYMIFVVICSFILTMMQGTAKIIFGSVLLFIFYMTIYDYSLREAVYHKRPYTEMQPTYKYVLLYGGIINIFLWVGILSVLLFDSFITRLFYILFDSMFSFIPIFDIVSPPWKFHIIPALIVTVFNFLVPLLGYYHGMIDNSISKIINKYIYGGKPPVRKKKNKR